MRRAVVAAATTVILAGLLVAWAPWQAGPAAPPRPADAEALPPPAAAAEASASSAAVHPGSETPAHPSDEISDAEAKRLALIRADAAFNDRANQQLLAPAADARWNEAVDQGGYSAEDFDPAVRDFFRRMTLEPRYAEGGRIEGLVIRSMTDDHPLARLGFRVGDRIDRIQGVRLRDPAEIPSLLARLGTHITFCVDRPEAEFCREVVLE